jgi:hypothetical protein
MLACLAVLFFSLVNLSNLLHLAVILSAGPGDAPHSAQRGAESAAEGWGRGAGKNDAKTQASAEAADMHRRAHKARQACGNGNTVTVHGDIMLLIMSDIRIR